MNIYVCTYIFWTVNDDDVITVGVYVQHKNLYHLYIKMQNIYITITQLKSQIFIKNIYFAKYI